MSARDMALGDLYLEQVPPTELAFRAGERNGTKHPGEDCRSLYVDVQSSRGWLSGYVDPEIFPLLMQALQVQT